MKIFWVWGQLPNYHWFQFLCGLYQIMNMEPTPITFLREMKIRAETAAVPMFAYRRLVVKDK